MEVRGRRSEGEKTDVGGRRAEGGGQRAGVTQVEHPEGVRFNRAPRGGIFDPE